MAISSINGRPGLLPSLADSLHRINQGHWSPAVDIAESATDYVLQADLPGLDRDDIQVSLHNGTLIIEGARKPGISGRCWNPHRVERFSGSFWRCFALPVGLDTASMQIRLANGVLEIIIPKA